MTIDVPLYKSPPKSEKYWLDSWAYWKLPDHFLTEAQAFRKLKSHYVGKWLSPGLTESINIFLQEKL